MIRIGYLILYSMVENNYLTIEKNRYYYINYTLYKIYIFPSFKCFSIRDNLQFLIRYFFFVVLQPQNLLIRLAIAFTVHSNCTFIRTKMIWKPVFSYKTLNVYVPCHEIHLRYGTTQ